MGTSRYPHLHQIARSISLEKVWRIIPIKYQNDPVGMGKGTSRFSAPNQEYKILYAAQTLHTAIRETLIRDKFDNKEIRQIPLFKILALASTVLKTNEQLNVLDLTDGGATNVGIPSSVRHSKGYSRSRLFALEVYNEMPQIDGFRYVSRLDDSLCYAIFDRAVARKLVSTRTMSLSGTPEFRDAVSKLNVSIRYRKSKQMNHYRHRLNRE